MKASQHSPLCCVSFAVPSFRTPEDAVKDIMRWATELCSLDWTPVFSLGSWIDLHEDLLEEADLPGEVEIVSACLSQLARAEALLLLPGWAKSERCRVVREFAKMNGLQVYEIDDADDIVFEIPPADEFQAKYLTVEISHRHGHMVG